MEIGDNDKGDVSVDETPIIELPVQPSWIWILMMTKKMMMAIKVMTIIVRQ